MTPELKQLAVDMEPFRIHKTLKNGIKVSYIDTDAFLVSKKIYAPAKYGYSPALREDRIHDYLKFEKDLEELSKYKRKVDYAKQKQLEEQELSAH